MTSTIHDLGYRHYDGERLSSGSAWSALLWQGVRTMFGLGRGARAKALPVFVLVFSCVPAILTVFIASQSPLPVRHAAYFSSVAVLYVLFAAAQAPELFSRDQANRVLPLMLSRDLSRWQYASARLASVVLALFALVLAPQLVLLLGAIGVADDTLAVFNERWSLIGPVLAISVFASVLLGSIASCLAAFTPRRNLATAAVVGLFLVLGAATTALGASGVLEAATVQLFNPMVVLDLTSRLLFAEPGSPMRAQPLHSVAVYIGMIGVFAAAAVSALWWRMQRVDA